MRTNNTPSTIDFARINAVALSNLEGLLPRWLPEGRANGSEFVVGSLDGEAGRSLSINLTSGVWKDFAEDAGGSDPVSLFAAIHRLGQAEAARKLAAELGLEPSSNGSAPRPKVTSTAIDLLGKQKKDPWRAMLTIPDHAPPPPNVFRRKEGGHWVEMSLSCRWTYRNHEGLPMFHVCRFQHPDGGKEIIPQTLCYTLDEKEAWRWKSYPEPRPLYGLDRLARSAPETPVLLVEGEKTADASLRLLPELVAMTWPGGSKAVKKVFFKPLAGRRVVIWPDADKPGFEAALALAARLHEAGAADVSIISPPETVAEGWDLADAEGEGWTTEKVTTHITAHTLNVADFEGLAKQRYGIEGKAKDEAKKSAHWFPFKVTPDSVYYLEEDGEATWLCSSLEVAARTCNVDGQDHGRLLYITDARGNRHQWAMPMTTTAGDGNEYRANLKYLGLELAPGNKGKQRLELYLTLARPTAWVTCVNRVGWHNRRFVLPDAVFGPQDEEGVILQGGPADHAFRVAGSLQDWQEAIGRVCPGNSRLVFVVSAALAAPLLALAGAESGGFHLTGGSSCGKTTSMRVAGSVCGGGGLNGYMRPWRTTDNGLESVSSGACDCLLVLDEVGQADAKTAGATAYMLANGSGKVRSRRDGTARKPHEWRVLFLSTGEVTMADKIAEDGRSRPMAGQAVRVVDLKADAGAGMGIFENLHGFASSADLANHLNEHARTIYGSPLRAFLDKLTEHYDEVAQAAPRLIREFVADVCPQGADGQVSRVAARFGLVAYAGELGASWGVLPWPKGEARQAAARCFQDWLSARGGTGAAEVTAGLAQVRQFFQAHGAARFETWGEAAVGSKIVNRAGVRRKDESTEEWSFYVFQDVFKTEVCRGHDMTRVLRDLKDRGLLLTQEAKGLTVKPRIPGVGSGTRFYHIAPGILGDEEKGPALPKQGGTRRDGRDTAPSQGLGCPDLEGGMSGQSGQRVSPVEVVPTCPYRENDTSGHQEASIGAVSLLAPNVPTHENDEENKRPTTPELFPHEVLI